MQPLQAGVDWRSAPARLALQRLASRPASIRLVYSSAASRLVRLVAGLSCRAGRLVRGLLGVHCSALSRPHCRLVGGRRSPSRRSTGVAWPRTGDSPRPTSSTWDTGEPGQLTLSNKKGLDGDAQLPAWVSDAERESTGLDRKSTTGRPRPVGQADLSASASSSCACVRTGCSLASTRSSAADLVDYANCCFRRARVEPR